VGTASIIALIVEAVRISETSVYFDEATRRYIPEACLHIRRFENLKYFITAFTKSRFCTLL
jgi:hypothetical protein